MTRRGRGMYARDSGPIDTLPRVFVSSVMEGYRDYREATRQSIRLAGCDPVLAEDLAAQGFPLATRASTEFRVRTPFVLLLGARFGWIAPSGRSATEEEYEEACQRHLPILVFVQAGVSHEPRQREFVKRVEDYIGGHFRKSFQEANDLRHLVEESVRAGSHASIALNARSGPTSGKFRVRK